MTVRHETGTRRDRRGLFVEDVGVDQGRALLRGRTAIRSAFEALIE